MTKQDLATELANRAQLSKSFALYVIDHTLDAITESLENGDSVFLRGLGTFTVNEKPERHARNPRTGEEVTVPARKSIKYKPSLTLKARING